MRSVSREPDLRGKPLRNSTASGLEKFPNEDPRNIMWSGGSEGPGGEEGVPGRLSWLSDALVLADDMRLFGPSTSCEIVSSVITGT